MQINNRARPAEQNQPKNPYDFVQLEGKVKRDYAAGDAVIAQDRYGTPHTYSGTLHCALTTETPLFIHHGQSSGGAALRCFYRENGKPAIPATSLKGMIRAMIELVSNGCLSTLPRYKPSPTNVDVYATYNIAGRSTELLASALGQPGSGDGKQRFRETYVPCWERGNLCLSCRMFGMSEEENKNNHPAVPKATPLGGRLFIGSAHALGEASITAQAIRFPSIRGGPRPHHKLFYFRDANRSNEQIGGRKLYYHHNDWTQAVGYMLASVQQHQTFVIESYSGSFDFEITFQNLTEEELDTLIYALELEDTLRHHLGFGRPFGLGTVRITVDRQDLLKMSTPGTAGNTKTGPERFLTYALDDETMLWDRTQRDQNLPWKEQKRRVIQRWEQREGGPAALADLRRIYRWPSQENYEYPSFGWFRSFAARTTTLDSYQQNPESKLTNRPRQSPLAVDAKEIAPCSERR